MDVKKCFNALKKCNEIGKKMTQSSIYVLINGMIIAYQNKYDKDDKNEYVAYGVNISFIGDKLCKDLDALCYIPVIINGTDFYRMTKEYQFNRFEIDDDYLYIIYRGLFTDDSNFNNDFIELAKSKGYHESYIQSEINNGFNNDIDLYEIYLNYKKTYKPKEQYKEFKIECKILKDSNDIIDKSNDIISELELCEYITEKDMDSEIYQKIMNSGRPTVFKFRDNNDNEIFKIRLMKSLFKTASTSSNINIKLLKNENNNFYYVLLNIINKEFHTVIIYRAVNY